MKILHLMAGLGEASGVANIARRFARAQRERGDEAVLLAPAVKWNPIYFGFAFAFRAWREARRADEIWVHCSWTFPVWFGAWLAKKRRGKENEKGSRLVVVPEGSFDPKRLNNQSGWKKRLVAPLDRWVLRRADEVLALCEPEVTWVKDFEPADNVRLARFPLFMASVSRSPDTVGAFPRNAQNIPAFPSLHVLFLGRAEDPLKGVRFLEQAVQEMNRDCSSSLFPSTSIALRIVSNHFGEELERDWAWCDVLCLPTLSDNFGLVVAEALERGKRVIVTDGAPAWGDGDEGEGEGEEWRDRLDYVRGYRDGTDEARVSLLKAALRKFTLNS